MSVNVYYHTRFVAAVCAPRDMMLTRVIELTQAAVPCATDRGWRHPQGDWFSDGRESPCPCNSNPETHKHWLLVA